MSSVGGVLFIDATFGHSLGPWVSTRAGRDTSLCKSHAHLRHKQVRSFPRRKAAALRTRPDTPLIPFSSYPLLPRCATVCWSHLVRNRASRA